MVSYPLIFSPHVYHASLSSGNYDAMPGIVQVLARYSHFLEVAVETIKTASFEYLIDLAHPLPEGGYEFDLDGTIYHIADVLEISNIARKHGYIVIY